MSEERGEGKWLGGFVVGFVLGIVVCGGAGGTFAVYKYRQLAMAIEHARAEEAAARATAEFELYTRLLGENRQTRAERKTLAKELNALEADGERAEKLLIAPKEK